MPQMRRNQIPTTKKEILLLDYILDTYSIHGAGCSPLEFGTWDLGIGIWNLEFIKIISSLYLELLSNHNHSKI